MVTLLTIARVVGGLGTADSGALHGAPCNRVNARAAALLRKLDIFINPS